MSKRAEGEPGSPILVLSARGEISEEEYLAVLREVAEKHGRAMDIIDVLTTSPDPLQWPIIVGISKMYRVNAGRQKGNLKPYGMVIIDADTTDYYIRAGFPEGVRDSYKLVYRNRLGFPHGDYRDAVNCLLKIEPDRILSGGQFDVFGHLN